MSISLTRILQQITGLNTFFQGPNAGRSNGVVLEDSDSVTFTTDGQGNIQANATVSGLPVATEAGQVPTSTGAGTTYTAQTPAVGAMVLIQKQTVSEAADSVTFSAIPQTFTNLKLVAYATGTQYNTGVTLEFNGDSTTGHYEYNYISGSGGAVSSGFDNNAPNIYVANLAQTGNGSSGFEIIVPNYSSAVPAAVGSLNDCLAVAVGVQTNRYSGYWNQSEVITSLTLVTINGNFDVGSVFSLYGLA